MVTNNQYLKTAFLYKCVQGCIPEFEALGQQQPQIVIYIIFY